MLLDIFNQSAFDMISLTDAINTQPFVPGRAGTLVNWNPSGVSTLTVMVEEKNGVLTMLNPTPRGGPGEAIDKTKRVVRPLVIPHYERPDAIYADEVQGIRAFGSESDVESVMGKVNERLATHAQDFDATLEYQRLGALKGLILNADTSTLYDLFTVFGVTQETEVAFDLTNASTSLLRKKCAAVIRLIADNMQGASFNGVHALCGDAFFDDLVANPGVIASYQTGGGIAAALRDPYIYPSSGAKVYGGLEFGGIVFENYRGSIGATKMVDTDKCHIFPMGAPGLFKTVFGPADYMDTVNTNGLPRYARQRLMDNEKGVHLEMQMNALSYCTRPKVLIKGKRGS